MILIVVWVLAGHAAAAERPNIVLVMADDQGWGQVGYNGHPHLKTLPQALKRAGYATGHFGKWHLGGVGGPGVPVLGDDPNHPGHYGFDYWLSATNFFDNNPLMSRMGEFVYLEGESSELMVQEALGFMKEQGDTPFLAVIWFGSPHFPFIASEEDTRGLPAGNKGRLANHLGEIVAIDRSIGM
ncbi:MAG: sulfatase-like hydrolase/transferase, partial [Planctomycetota bacterium]